MIASIKSWLIGLGAVGFCCLGACTQITDETGAQCHSQADCLAKGPEFAQTTCTADRICAKLTASEKACNTNKDCIDAAGGAPSVCRKSDFRCTELVNPTCQTLYYDTEDLLDDNVLILGQTTPSDENGRQSGFAVELARKEIKRLGGAPPATPGGPNRPIAILRCDGEGNDIQTARRMAAHLAETVQSQYIIGPFAGAFALAEQQFYVSKNVLTISQVPLIDLTGLEDRDLAFRISNSDALNITAIGPYLKDIVVPKLVAEGTLATVNDPIRIAVLSPADATGQSTLQKITSTLKYNNGKTVAENQAAGNFAVFSIGNPQDPIGNPTPELTRNAAVQKALDYKPHFVIYNGVPIPPPFDRDMGWLTLNRLWPAADKLPFTMTLNQGFATIMPALMGQFGSIPGITPARATEARQKFIGLRSQSFNFNGKDFGAWVSNLKISFPELTAATVAPLAAMSYERVYMFVYSLAAIGNSAVTGPELARGLRRATGTGVPIKWGSEDFSKAIATLAAGNEITYTGPDGLVRFDEKGDRLGQVDLYCIQGKGGAPAAILSTGYIVDPTTGLSSGTLSCPELP
jgi:ABC-type branched-subunit amino acid transport system substrate-binding protein